MNRAEAPAARAFDSFVTVLLYYAGWFGSVILAPTRYSLLAFFFPLALFVFLRTRGKMSARTLAPVTAIAIAGMAFDWILIQANLVSVEGAAGWMIPPWLTSIWLSFSFSMFELGRTWRLPFWIASLLGFVLGPLSYKSGELFQVLFFITPMTIWIYACFWALAFPLVLALAKRSL